jgi:alpha-D-ribose 1-methylphosphonate 5-phosphate C-P lyase
LEIWVVLVATMLVIGKAAVAAVALVDKVLLATLQLTHHQVPQEQLIQQIVLVVMVKTIPSLVRP